jgi:hypothetical protein
MRLGRLLDGLIGRSTVVDEAELGRMLGEAGLAGSPTVTNPASLHDQAAMQTYFGVDPATAPAAFQGALRDAERVCACCQTAQRCHDWLEAGRTDDSPRLFCPNAELLEEVAAAQRRTGRGT